MGKFRVADLFQLRDEEDPDDDWPPEVNLWVWATSTAAVTGTFCCFLFFLVFSFLILSPFCGAGLISGGMRGARMGYARAMAAIKMRGIAQPHRRSMISTLMYGEMARTALATGGKLGLFVGCLLGVDIVGLEHEAIAGPGAPAIGGFVAGLLIAARKGPTAAVSSSMLGGMMGLSFGLLRYGLGDYYQDALKMIFPTKAEQDQNAEAKS
jgi:hypothetical protein